MMDLPAYPDLPWLRDHRHINGVFRIVIIDNIKAVVTDADAIDPRLNDGFVEYAQNRGFVVDPARIRSPQDKPRVERAVSYVRASFFKGEHFLGLWVPKTRSRRSTGRRFAQQQRPSLRLHAEPMVGK
jgi:transposase